MFSQHFLKKERKKVVIRYLLTYFSFSQLSLSSLIFPRFFFTSMFPQFPSPLSFFYVHSFLFFLFFFPAIIFSFFSPTFAFRRHGQNHHTSKIIEIQNEDVFNHLRRDNLKLSWESCPLFSPRLPQPSVILIFFYYAVMATSAPEWRRE